MKRLISAFAFALAGVLPAQAQTVCHGTDLIAAMPPEARADLHARTAQVPFHRGLIWQAEKGDARIVMAGTYHFPDPRHQALLDRLLPEIERADAVYVEANTDAQAQLQTEMARNPALIMEMDGPTLPERLPAPLWADLSQAMSERGMPPFLISKMRPWYVSVMLGVSPCAMQQIQAEGADKGLDGLIEASARAIDLPVHSLEPWNTLFSIFDGMTTEQEQDMLQMAMVTAKDADDYGVTLGNSYFNGDTWLIWQYGLDMAYEDDSLTREQADEQIALAQDRLIDRRNASWIAPLEAAAADAATRGKPVFAAFGALHLPGEGGVLNLLAENGWVVSELAR
ncbi:MAG: TraB/GumN family protein [Paracoccus sp. (in: a-proteobacteria)]|uniref:TraB/GumN family protein n=1 Tax=Paracoccus sp. TaxID=267 RepID=UPI0026DEF187|nr:TraB/GumN family protein [Paracoccus sp. (in: a-proteobacteria)]MDO5622337.1 TraB/GumN family protein [Paracoccus sp. (in: a-proteobacteria)]